MLSIGQREEHYDFTSSLPQMPILATQVWATLEREQRKAMGREILALLCPDWRQASMVLNAHDGSIEYSNWRCLQLLNTEGVIRMVGERLDFLSRTLNMQFRKCLRKVSGGDVGSTYLVGRNPETDKPYLITIHGSQGFLREALELCFSGTPDDANYVIVDITVDTDLPDPSAVNALAKGFGLSRAETHLMQLFACGMTLEEVAERRGVKINTARQQMKAVLSKTNSDRQQDLMRLVFSLCPCRSVTPRFVAPSSKTW